MALPIIVAIIFLLATLILAFSQYSAARIRATGALLNDLSALAAAEAGLNAVLLEMRNSQGWETHELEIGADGELEWKAEIPRPVRLTGDPDLVVEDSRKGTYKGKIGKGVFAAEFRVRAGRVPLDDDLDTPAIDESRRFVHIEALGKKRDPTKRQDRFTRIVAIAEVSNFTEYVIYDAEKVILGMGSHNDSNHSNVFADGRIYGHQGVKLGNIERSGTRQKFVNLDAIRSKSDIEYTDPYKVTFQQPGGADALAVDVDSSNDSSGPSPLETAGGRILDGKHGGELTLPRLNAEFYRRMADQGGVDISGLPKKKEYIPLYGGELPDQVIELDFGRAGYDGSDVAADDEKTLQKPYPADFNGLIYSSEPLSVWGNPDRDVTLFCEKDIFISGDFNIRGEHRQNYQDKYRMPDGTPVDGTPYYQYRSDSEEVWLDSVTGELEDPKKRDRVAVALISLGRIWFDYRHPARFLANEFRGLIKFELASILLGGDLAKVLEYMRYSDVGSTPNPEPIPASRVSGLGSDGSADLSYSLQDYFGRNGASASNLFVTTPTYDVIKAAFLQAVQNGDLTRAELDGSPASLGLLQVITDGLEVDEPEFEKHWPNHPGADIEPPVLGAFSAAARLYELVYDERAANLQLPRQPHGKFSDLEGTRDEDVVDGVRWPFLADELYMPQMSMYSMLFISAARNDADTTSDDPRKMSRRFDDLGNGRDTKSDGNQRVHFLSTMQALEEWESGPSGRNGSVSNITTPLIQRFVGSEIRLAQTKNHPPSLKTGNYWPTLRRRIYDRTLAMHPPPLIPQMVELRSWTQRGATKAVFNGF